MKRLYKSLPRSLAVQYRRICKRYCEPIAIDELAAQSGCSTVHFINLFRRIYGTTPKKYITLRRLGRAKLFLAASELSVRRIAELCGYDDEFYFCKLFKRRFGVTPTVYRKTVGDGAAKEI